MLAHLDAEQPAHRAVRAVGGDEVAGAHGAVPAAASRSVARTPSGALSMATSSVPSSNRAAGNDPTCRRSTASSQSCGTVPGAHGLTTAACSRVG